MDKVFQEFIKIVDDKGIARIASALGYRSSSALYYWIRKKQIPHHRIKDVEIILKKLKKEKNYE